jgi:hypothetical protein
LRRTRCWCDTSGAQSGVDRHKHFSACKAQFHGLKPAQMRRYSYLKRLERSFDASSNRCCWLISRPLPPWAASDLNPVSNSRIQSLKHISMGPFTTPDRIVCFFWVTQEALPLLYLEHWEAPLCQQGHHNPNLRSKAREPIPQGKY